MVQRTCLIPDCENSSRARGWCQKHYDAWYKHGDPLHQRVLARDQNCTVDECENKIHARGLCSKHYERWLARGTTELEKKTPQTRTIKQEVIERPDFCELLSCSRRHYARGLCGPHYGRWMRTGDVKEHTPVKEWRTGCEVIWCNRRHRSKGLCGMHYGRMRASGTLEAGAYRRTFEQVFEGKLSRQGDCLVWTGLRNPQGYGQVSWRGKTLSAHRFMWEKHNGPIPEGIEIDHICHNPPCVELKHIRLATRKENARYRWGAMPNNASGIRGVTYHPTSGKWRSRVSADGKIYSLGLFVDPAEAGRIAAIKRLELGFPQSDHDRQLIDGTFKYAA